MQFSTGSTDMTQVNPMAEMAPQVVCLHSNLDPWSVMYISICLI